MKKYKSIKFMRSFLIIITFFSSTNPPTLFAGTLLPIECKYILSSEEDSIKEIGTNLLYKSKEFITRSNKMPESTPYVIVYKTISFVQKDECTLRIPVSIDKINRVIFWNLFDVDANGKVSIIDLEN
ncbi:hypothetical protein [Aquitalea sp. ASV11]|uniref:hypothetical protein n=1 Tax=Aquitalea sp. ASV11 TaxID=2795103 RepID=UPI0018EAE486|nr:hypothetical protein [Aquitalea sp. ASV11]